MDFEAAHDRKFVVGLGNPGRRYLCTRHNVGFEVLDVLLRRWSLGDGRTAFEGLVWDAQPSVPGGPKRRVTLLAPQTYMNCSGRSVRKLLDFYKASTADVLIVLDDLALPLGQLRVRAEGSAGGHNGLEDVLRACGTEAVARLRIGIDGPPGGMDPKDYVLSRFAEREQEDIGAAIQQAADAVEMWIVADIQRVMETYNRKQGTES